MPEANSYRFYNPSLKAVVIDYYFITTGFIFISYKN